MEQIATQTASARPSLLMTHVSVLMMLEWMAATPLTACEPTMARKAMLMRFSPYSSTSDMRRMRSTSPGHFFSTAWKQHKHFTASHWYLRSLSPGHFFSTAWKQHKHFSASLWYLRSMSPGHFFSTAWKQHKHFTASYWYLQSTSPGHFFSTAWIQQQHKPSTASHSTSFPFTVQDWYLRSTLPNISSPQPENNTNLPLPHTQLHFHSLDKTGTYDQCYPNISSPQAANKTNTPLHHVHCTNYSEIPKSHLLHTISVGIDALKWVCFREIKQPSVSVWKRVGLPWQPSLS